MMVVIFIGGEEFRGINTLSPAHIYVWKHKRHYHRNLMFTLNAYKSHLDKNVHPCLLHYVFSMHCEALHYRMTLITCNFIVIIVKIVYTIIFFLSWMAGALRVSHMLHHAFYRL